MKSIRQNERPLRSIHIHGKEAALFIKCDSAVVRLYHLRPVARFNRKATSLIHAIEGDLLDMRYGWSAVLLSVCRRALPVPITDADSS
jgi:hypothetical protein